MGSLKNLETDIILNAAMDREKSAQLRYDLVNKVVSKSISKDTAYIIDNLGHLKQLKLAFENENYGFFFRDEFNCVISCIDNKDVAACI